MYPPIGRGGLNAHFPHHHLCTTAATPSGSAPVLNSTTRPVSGDDVANKVSAVDSRCFMQHNSNSLVNSNKTKIHYSKMGNPLLIVCSLMCTD